MQRVPADKARWQNQPEIQQVKQRPAEVRQTCPAQTLLHKVQKVQLTAGQEALIRTGEAITGDKEKGGDAVATQNLQKQVKSKIIWRERQAADVDADNAEHTKATQIVDNCISHKAPFWSRHKASFTA